MLAIVRYLVLIVMSETPLEPRGCPGSACSGTAGDIPDYRCKKAGILRERAKRVRGVRTPERY